jgi:hypothetical protein
MSPRPNELENYAIWEQYNPRTGNWLSDTKDIILRFLQDVFFQMPAGSQSFHFQPGHEPGSTDEETTEIILSDAGSLNTDSMERRPGIIISRGPMAYGNTSLDQLLKHEPGLMHNTKVRTDLLAGSFVVNCVSRKGLEAETVALIVAKAIRYYRNLLQKAGFFHIGALVQVGAETPPGALVSGDAAEDFINVPVSFPVYYQESWTVEKDAPLLAALTLKTEYVVRQFDGSLLNPGCIGVDGHPIEGSDGVIVQSWKLEV